MLRFDPFSDLDAMTRGLLTQSGTDRSPRFMPMDLYKVDDHYVLTADLPGVDPGSVDVTVDNGTLTLTAHRSARSEDSVQWLTSERFFGTYRRQLALGEGVDTTRIAATYESRTRHEFQDNGGTPFEVEIPQAVTLHAPGPAPGAFLLPRR